MYKKKLTTIIFICLTSMVSYSQIKGTVINSTSNKGISYANLSVKNKPIGTSADRNGNFILFGLDMKDTLIVSAVGYTTKSIVSDKVKDTIYLTPETIELNPISLKVTKNENKKNKPILRSHANRIKKSNTDTFFRNSDEVWIIGRLYEYQSEYAQTPYIEKLEFVTRSEVEGSIFNIRLYNVDSNGFPSSYLWRENIVVSVKKGKRVTEIDISKLNIKFPEEGIVVAVEGLHIETNRYEQEIVQFESNGNKKSKTETFYEPGFGMSYIDSNKSSFLFSMGNWIRMYNH
ncbi:MAG TPA: carboxypeptidase-like regulatory domain-containing protein [Flavobacteriaceae bacterium]|nr:carboxypeptidase-like regulatory domain-containing protein [Flavobacteriaceae bacterium]